MKRFFLVLVLLPALFLASCNTEDNSNNVNNINNTNNTNNTSNTNNINNTNNTNNINNTNNTNTEVLSGQLSVSLDTVSYGGVYASANCTAIWIQTPEGEHIKTLYKAAQFYGFYLLTWRDAGGMETADTVTEASRYNHNESISGQWNMTDTNDATVIPGDYDIWVEFTEDNGLGVYTSVPLTIDGSPFTEIPEDTENFTNWTIDYTP